MLTVKGRFESGVVRLLEPVEEREGQEVAILFLPDSSSDAEQSLVTEWNAASNRSLRDVWNNDEDSIYDLR